MKKIVMTLVVSMLSSGIASASLVDFGSGANAFSLDFTDTISSATNPASGYGLVNHDYQMGTYEITNDQYTKFKALYGAVSGDPYNAYNSDPSYTGANQPTNNSSWYEAAQFVNWLNTSTNHDAAYKFTGTQGTSNGNPNNRYRYKAWDSGDAGYDASNPYRHKDSMFFLPSEDEWVKAAYWNGSALQTYANVIVGSVAPVAGTETNYFSTNSSPWDVGSGLEELNGTHGMMGNVWEWTESPYSDSLYGDAADRSIRGGSFYSPSDYLSASYRYNYSPNIENNTVGFRVASIPEPCTIGLLAIGGVSAIRRRRAKA